MSNNKQSSVRWVIEELQKFTRGESKFFSKTAIINHVDRMHKEEIKNAFDKYNKFIDDEIQLGFLKQEQGERLKWYYRTYFIDKIQGGNNRVIEIS